MRKPGLPDPGGRAIHAAIHPGKPHAAPSSAFRTPPAAQAAARPPAGSPAVTASAAVLLVASLLAIGALSQPLAERLRLPVSAVYALVGLGLAFLGTLAAGPDGAGLGGTGLGGTGLGGPELGTAGFGEMGVLAHPPLGSALFLHALLPILLFQGALAVDIHRMREDAAPILMLALVAVVVAIFGIGLALWPFAGVPLAACLLLAAVVATTDPVAVIAIFRSTGAPERLTRLVEGESLFNDAAAVAFFLAFTGLLLRPGEVSAAGFAADLLLLPIGGGILGWLAALLLLRLPRRLLDDRIAFASLSLALPFLTFWLAEEALQVSGVLAVVAAGVTLGTLAPGRAAPAAWRYASDAWELIGEAATVLVFLLTALIAPQLMAGWSPRDFGLLAVLFVAALAARGAILLGLFPLLSRLGAMAEVPRAYRIAAFWGGLRGSMTLVLALAVTEATALPPEIRSFVAALATAFTLATLFVQGPTLRPLIGRLGLDRLSGVDRALRDLALAAARRRGAERGRALALRLGGAEAEAGAETPEAERAEAGTAEAEAGAAALPPAERLAAALAALTARERLAALERFDAGLLDPRIARRLLAVSRRRLDLSRLGGARGYAEADRLETAFGPMDRAAVGLQRRLGLGRPLARRLALRFETLIEAALTLDALGPFVEADLAPVFGEETAAGIRSLAEARAAGLARETAALRLQYPVYAAALARRTAARAAQAQEAEDIARLRRTGVISAEVERDLAADLARRAAALAPAPALDIGLDTRALIDACPLFAALAPAERAGLAPLMRPFFAAPGDRLIVRGERGRAAFFLSSGAVEADTGAAVRRLGRGEIFGEMALLFDLPRQADVTAIAYSALLRLSAADFARFLDRHPELRARVLETGRRRLAENAAGPAPAPGTDKTAG